LAVGMVGLEFGIDVVSKLLWSRRLTVCKCRCKSVILVSILHHKSCRIPLNWYPCKKKNDHIRFINRFMLDAHCMGVLFWNYNNEPTQLSS
jgi:hypothetical protein